MRIEKCSRVNSYYRFSRILACLLYIMSYVIKYWKI